VQTLLKGDAAEIVRYALPCGELPVKHQSCLLFAACAVWQQTAHADLLPGQDNLTHNDISTIRRYFVMHIQRHPALPGPP
jgi:hypothetical protein